MPPKRALEAGANGSAVKRARGQDGAAESTDDFSNKLAALGLQPNATLSDVLEYEIPEFSDGYDADLMGGAEDRQLLSTMKEFEREAVLQERREKRIQGQQNAQLQRGLLETLIGEMRQAEKKRGGRRQTKIVQKGPKRKVADDEEDDASKPAARGRKAKVESESEDESSEASAASSSDDSDSDSDSSSGSSSGSDSEEDDSEEEDSEEEEEDSDASGAPPKGKRGAGKKAPAGRRQVKKKPLRRKSRAVSSEEEGSSSDDGDASDEGGSDEEEDEEGRQGGPASGRGSKGQGGLSKKDQMLRARARKLAGLESDEESEDDEEGGGGAGGRRAGGRGEPGRGARKAAYDDGYGSDDDDDVEFADEEDSSGLLAQIAAQSSQVDSMGSPVLEAGQVRPAARKRRETAAEMLLRDKAPDLRQAEPSDLEAVHLRRSDCLKYMSSPVFKEGVVGCYVKWGKEWKVPPSKEEVAAGRATMYRVGRVHRVVHANNPSQGLKPYDPWSRDVEGLAKRRDIDQASIIRVTDLQVHVAVGSSTEAAIPGRPNVARLIKFTQLSDQPITPLEWHEYKQRLNEQYDRLGRQEEDRVPTKWEITRAAGWKDKLKQASFSTSHVEKLLREKEMAQARNSGALARALNPTRMGILLKEKLAECERALAELAAEEERVREKAAEEEASRPADELDDGLGPAPALGGSGQGAAAARLGALTTQRIGKEKEKAGLLASLQALEAEEIRRRAKHESLVKEKLDAGKNVSVLTSKVNERLMEANDRRMAHAADMERNTDQAAELAEIDNNPFLRRKTQPVNLFKVNKGAAGEAAAAAPAPAKKSAEEAPKEKRPDVLAMLDDMDVHAGPAHESHSGAGGGVGSGAGSSRGAGTGAGQGDAEVELDLGLHAPAPAPAPQQMASPPVTGGTSLAAFRARLAAKA